MEEEVGIKVTRLRRRLSVEAEDVKSPATQSTPTKKRGGRLAAKPQLELIDENAPETAPKRTRKSTARDIADPEPEKTITPSRRSARVRSNTSIVSETPSDLPEDKGTPSRRSTRIKSNTSLIAEPVSVNSPRAKRAARRTSLAGSDNETPITPVRQTRRTRKDSTSSIDKPAEPNAGKLGSQVTEVIVEESETNVKETKSTVSPKHDSPGTRKSPRLVRKSGRKSSSLDNDGNKENEAQGEKETSETVAAEKSLTESKTEETNDNDGKSSEQNNLSVASKNLITELEEVPTKGKKSLNKSTTAVGEPQIKSKRNRAKSWTTISVESSHESSFCSDSEASKKRNKKKTDSLNLSNLSGSGDGIMVNNKKDTEQENTSLNSSTLSNKKKNKRNEMSMTEETVSNDVSIINSSTNKSVTKVLEKNDASKDMSKDVEALNASNNLDVSVTEKFFNQKPEDVIKSLVFIDDSDSNNGSIGKENNNKDLDSGDQCVPVVDHALVNDNKPDTQNNLSYEPMDIDETMPDNVSLNDSATNETKSVNRKSILNFSQIKNDSLNKSKRKSVNTENSIQEGINQSQRKSSITETVNQSLEESNKSKRKFSLSNGVSEDVPDGILSQSSSRKSIDDGNAVDKSINKSKRKSSMSSEQNMEEDSNNSGRKSLSADTTLNDASINKGSNKSKRKSSISNITSDDNTNEGSNKSTRKSAIIDLANDEKMDNTLNKSKRKSAMTSSFTAANVSIAEMKPSDVDQSNNDDTMNKSTNKSKRKSSISNNESMNNNLNKSKNKSVSLDKTDNENKSTLVLSQIKDVTETEGNLESSVPKDNNDSNDQLSKSVNVPNVVTEKETDKKNLSLTYSTSTPLQQKSMKKLGLQINSSIITPSSVKKVDKKDNLSKSKVESSILSEKNESSEEDGSEEEEEPSAEKSNLIDDEAEEASDDYESGDSRDDEEREYEEQHQIVEKGETLDSDDEEDYSDDSDYEKGSFIVSSENEDDDLLSGSGDDLDMSADELTMSAKSKKKFNERKTKEQKKASREMFEARHKLNESTKAKSKKNNRQRLDSSSSESDEEVATQPKKNRRQRIDSSQDISVAQSDADKSLSKKKKAKRLSESVCEDNEKEITIREDNQNDQAQQDPLTVQNIIKEEPKTPQKLLDISTVAVTNIDEVEEVNVDENVSIMKSNQTSDPLQPTEAENNEDDDSNEESISENEEITQNYESVLNNLNKSGSKKIKSTDISLDLNKKAKQKAKEPIVDQLNLTQVKKTKQKKAEAENVAETKKFDKSLGNKSTDKVDKQADISEASSDSIDMKLLFPEDSNDSGMIMEDKKEIKQKDNVPEDFIPLKRSQAKTNILENTDTSLNKSKDESILNVSGKKKNKRKSSGTEEDMVTSTQDENLCFFVDTAGTLSNSNNMDANTSVRNSAKKNKQKNRVSFANIEESAESAVDDDADDAPQEVSYRSNKNKSIQDLNTTQANEVMQAGNTIETPNQSAKKKKKNKKGLNTSQNPDITLIENEDDVAEKSINTFATNVPNGSAKKKKKRLSESQTENETENDTPAETIQNISLGSAKKNKQKTAADTTEVEIVKVNKDDEDVSIQEQNTKTRKRKSSANQSIDAIDIKDEVQLTNDESLTTNNKKKKRKISNNDQNLQAQVEDTAIAAQEQEPKLPIENTKKKRKEVQNQELAKIGEENTKKNKKRKERDDDDFSKISKVLKQNSFDKVHVPRLPSIVLNQLDDKPNKKDIIEGNKMNVIATSTFVVEETKKRRNKPSNYLEESIYINDDKDGKKQKGSIKNPKVLPFIPTASTSGSGFTTNFKVNIIPQHTEFVAQAKDVLNFKNDYLHQKKIKKLGTFEMYKRQRNIKISKF